MSVKCGHVTFDQTYGGEGMEPSKGMLGGRAFLAEGAASVQALKLRRMGLA